MNYIYTLDMNYPFRYDEYFSVDSELMETIKFLNCDQYNRIKFQLFKMAI